MPGSPGHPVQAQRAAQRVPLAATLDGRAIPGVGTGAPAARRRQDAPARAALHGVARSLRMPSAGEPARPTAWAKSHHRAPGRHRMMAAGGRMRPSVPGLPRGESARACEALAGSVRIRRGDVRLGRSPAFRGRHRYVPRKSVWRSLGRRACVPWLRPWGGRRPEACARTRPGCRRLPWPGRGPGRHGRPAASRARPGDRRRRRSPR